MISKAKLDFLDSHRRINFKLITFFDFKNVNNSFSSRYRTKDRFIKFRRSSKRRRQKKFPRQSFRERDRRYSYSPVSQGITE